MPKLITLDLTLFASHCRVLARDIPGTGSLSCLPDLIVYYKIVERQNKEWDSIWDSVYLGRSAEDCNDHCGNRNGGIKAYATMVQDHLHNLNASIWNKWYESQKQTARVSDSF